MSGRVLFFQTTSLMGTARGFSHSSGLFAKPTRQSSESDTKSEQKIHESQSKPFIASPAEQYSAVIGKLRSGRLYSDYGWCNPMNEFSSPRLSWYEQIIH